jgi:hypothetical protein
MPKSGLLKRTWAPRSTVSPKARLANSSPDGLTNSDGREGMRWGLITANRGVLVSVSCFSTTLGKVEEEEGKQHQTVGK